jgi:hypothetical protein
MTQRLDQPTERVKVNAKELAEKRLIVKSILGGIAWMRAALQGFDFDAQTEQFGNVWRIVITVGWKPLPLPVEVVPCSEIDGRLV